MLLNEIKPSAFLADHVRLYRIIDFRFPSWVSIPFKAYSPRPEHCLQFMAKEPEAIQYPGADSLIKYSAAVFMGPHANLVHRHPGRETLGLQVVFNPAAVHQLTGVPANELANQYLDAETLFGTGTRRVNEQLFAAKDYGAMIKVVEKYLWECFKKNKHKNHPVDYVSTAIVREMETFSLDKFLKAACLSHRQLDRKFKERIGMPPKLFLQLTRFDKAFRMRNRLPNKDWLSIALHCGYYDYQHLAKDYKEFTGYTPAQFSAVDNAAPERILGDMEV
jgi:AraC-like DNA-binding protein